MFVSNVTTGLNTAIRASERAIVEAKRHSDKVKILVTSLTYHATGFMAEHLADRFGLKVVKVNMKFPLQSEEDVLDRFRQACLKNPGVTVAIVDHISSTSTVLWPVQKIAMLLKGLGVKRIIVDGAHAPGLAFCVSYDDKKKNNLSGV